MRIGRLDLQEAVVGRSNRARSSRACGAAIRLRCSVRAPQVQIAVFQPQCPPSRSSPRTISNGGVSDFASTRSSRTVESRSRRWGSRMFFDVRSRTMPRGRQHKLAARRERLLERSRGPCSRRMRSCTMPVRSRRSMKISCPRSRWRCTQPHTTTSCPICSGRSVAAIVRALEPRHRLCHNKNPLFIFYTRARRAAAKQEAARRSAVFLSVPPVRRKDLPAPSRP